MINNAITYYVSTYNNGSVSKYDTHKKSELREVYNNMLKINKKSPLYKLASTDTVKQYAIDLKETARQIKYVAANLTDEDGNISGSSKKKAISSNNKVAIAKYIGESSDKSDVIDDIELNVMKLASPQVNVGNFLQPDSYGLPKGPYSFDLSIGDYTYEFQFNVKSNDTNLDIQQRLSRLINKSNVGVQAEVIENATSHTALQITSDATGVSSYSNRGLTFAIVDTPGEENGDAVKFLGLDRVYEEPSNAIFTINGIEKSSASNTISIPDQFEIELVGTSVEGDNTLIGLKPDFDALVENLNEFIETYNGTVDFARNKMSDTYESGQFYRDISNIAKNYKHSLDASGFTVLPDGHLQLEESLLTQAAREGTLTENLSKLNQFKNSLVRKSENISLNPVQYIDKKMIAYPHPTRNMPSPYVTSMYSGFLFNGYI